MFHLKQIKWFTTTAIGAQMTKQVSSKVIDGFYPCKMSVQRIKKQINKTELKPRWFILVLLPLRGFLSRWLFINLSEQMKNILGSGLALKLCLCWGWDLVSGWWVADFCKIVSLASYPAAKLEDHQRNAVLIRIYSLIRSVKTL